MGKKLTPKTFRFLADKIKKNKEVITLIEKENKWLEEMLDEILGGNEL